MVAYRTFPALIPDERQYTLGQIPLARRQDLSGGNVRFLKGTETVKHRLTMPFTQRTAADARAIFKHWRGTQGTFIPFDVGSETWCGNSDYPDLTWRYLSAPQLTEKGNGIYDILVDLISVTDDLPARVEGQVPAATSIQITAETPVSPPDEPSGVFFRGRTGEVEVVGDDAQFSLDRVLAADVQTVEIANDPYFARKWQIPLTDPSRNDFLFLAAAELRPLLDLSIWHHVPSNPPGAATAVEIAEGSPEALYDFPATPQWGNRYVSELIKQQVSFTFASPISSNDFFVQGKVRILPGIPDDPIEDRGALIRLVDSSSGEWRLEAGVLMSTRQLYLTMSDGTDEIYQETSLFTYVNEVWQQFTIRRGGANGAGLDFYEITGMGANLELNAPSTSFTLAGVDTIEIGHAGGTSRLSFQLALLQCWQGADLKDYDLNFAAEYFGTDYVGPYSELFQTPAAPSKVSVEWGGVGEPIYNTRTGIDTTFGLVYDPGHWKTLAWPVQQPFSLSGEFLFEVVTPWSFDILMQAPELFGLTPPIPAASSDFSFDAVPPLLWEILASSSDLFDFPSALPAASSSFTFELGPVVDFSFAAYGATTPFYSSTSWQPSGEFSLEEDAAPPDWSHFISGRVSYPTAEPLAGTSGEFVFDPVPVSTWSHAGNTSSESFPTSYGISASDDATFSDLTP